MTATLVVVTGHPASGKTTLARAVAAQLGLPVFTKDTVKEALYDSLGIGDLDWSRRLGAAALAILVGEAEIVLRAGGNVVVEANFDPGWAGAELGAIVERTGAAAVTVVVRARPDVLVERYRRRALAGDRHPGHLDHLLVDELAERARTPCRPPKLPGPVLSVDTSEERPVADHATELADGLRALLVNTG